MLTLGPTSDRSFWVQDEPVVRELPAGVVSALRAASFTYRDVGATASEMLPVGYGDLNRSRELPADAFDSVVERLMTWQVHEAAGLRVSASSRRVEPNAVSEMFLGPRWLGIRAVCRVVYVVDEPDRAGFAYGTLPGHAESGEESFVVERQGERVQFTVRAFSNPANRLARLGGPMTSRVQLIIAERYLRAALS